MFLIPAALTLLGAGIIHSVVGERVILSHLYQYAANTPGLFPSRLFSQTIRIAWHATSIAWAGTGFMVYLLRDMNSETDKNVLRTVGVVYGLHAVILAFGTGGKHLAWIPFLLVALGIQFDVGFSLIF
ncbi:hypothetical protein HK098_003026 [Nowakowskiella sp. JEL0407]|nr:hypothetical protein HK098_003026 [Nowakowskiella sp. JEL0407]